MVALRVLVRKLPALLLPPLLVAGSVVAPTLDRDLFEPGAAVEAEHHPATCVMGHDHTLCSQVGLGRWVPVKPATRWLFFLREDLPRPHETHVPALALRADSCHPRAPPLA